MDVDLDPKNSVIKRFWCTKKLKSQKIAVIVLKFKQSSFPMR